MNILNAHSCTLVPCVSHFPSGNAYVLFAQGGEERFFERDEAVLSWRVCTKWSLERPEVRGGAVGLRWGPGGPGGRIVLARPFCASHWIPGPQWESLGIVCWGWRGLETGSKSQTSLWFQKWWFLISVLCKWSPDIPLDLDKQNYPKHLPLLTTK